MSDAYQTLSEPVDKRATRERRSQTGSTRKRLQVAHWRHNGSLASRTLAFLWPWDKQSFPGLYKGIQQSVGRPIAYQTWQNWVSGRARFAPWAAQALLDTLQDKRRDLDVLIGELSAYLSQQAYHVRHLSPGLRRKLDE